MISADMTVAQLLAEHPELLQFMTGYSRHFERLRNPLIRRVMAPRVTIAEAARMAGIPCDTLVTDLSRAAAPVPLASGPTARDRNRSDAPSAIPARRPKPAFLAELDPRRLVTLDLRDDIARGEEPFARIMTTVKALRPGEMLVLRAPFEPIPLYHVLRRRGFDYWSECRAPDDWTLWFFRESGAGAREPADATAERTVDTDSTAAPALTIDVRGLEPPQPMVRVLEGLEAMAPGATLEVIHDRRPLFLYPQLDARGFVHATDELRPGVVRIRITHPRCS
jgi:uncharacterized protein (DUF2249 family)